MRIRDVRVRIFLHMFFIFFHTCLRVVITYLTESTTVCILMFSGTEGEFCLIQGEIHLCSILKHDLNSSKTWSLSDIEKIKGLRASSNFYVTETLWKLLHGFPKVFILLFFNRVSITYSLQLPICLQFHSNHSACCYHSFVIHLPSTDYGLSLSLTGCILLYSE